MQLLHLRLCWLLMVFSLHKCPFCLSAGACYSHIRVHLCHALAALPVSYRPMSLCKYTGCMLHALKRGPVSLNSLNADTAVDALGDVTMMRDRLSWAMDELEVKHSEKQQWLSHLHFATLPLSGLSDVGANFIPYLVSAGSFCEDSSSM